MAMMLIDMTNQLAPVIYGLNALLLISSVALLADTPVNSWFRSLGRSARRPVALHRPMLVR